MRLDVYLTEEGYFNSRSQALLAIKEKKVKVNNRIITKAGYIINENDSISIIKQQYNFVSRGEIELQEYIKSIYQGTIYTSCRSIITPEELDVYIPDLKFAIEFNGAYYHSLEYDFARNTNKHILKTKLCEEKNIKLLHIFEDNWNSNKDKQKSLIIDYLNCKYRIKEKNKRHIYNLAVFKELGIKVKKTTLPKLKKGRKYGFGYFDCGEVII